MAQGILRLNHLVRELLSTHGGGEAFFSYLDEAVRSDISIIETLVEQVPQELSLIASGTFG